LTSILIITFSILIFKAIDLKTVNSYYPRLKDAYWIEPEYQKELPRVGIATLDDLISKTKEKKERDELALRLLIPKEKLIQWVEKAQLVNVKGLGVENLRLLEGVDIYSISALAEQDSEKLYEKMTRNFTGKTIPKKGKIRIWVREAQIKVRSSEF